MLILFLLACATMRYTPKTGDWLWDPVVTNAPDSLCTDDQVRRAADWWGLQVGAFGDLGAIEVHHPQHIQVGNLGETWWYTTEDGVVVTARVEVWDCDDARVLLHEIGHGLGWGHGPGGTIMAPRIDQIGLVKPEAAPSKTID